MGIASIRQLREGLARRASSKQPYLAWSEELRDGLGIDSPDIPSDEFDARVRWTPLFGQETEDFMLRNPVIV